MKKNNNYLIYLFAMIGICLIFQVGCKKGDDNNTETPSESAVTDIDGNVYQPVTIGTQVWLKENLKTTKYNDGTSIPNVIEDLLWMQSTTGAYCWYNNFIDDKEVYGALYNWFTVETGKLCPNGWHVPSNDEWITLIAYLGSSQEAGGKMKETGTVLWRSPNTAATNESGFSGRPGGMRNAPFNMKGDYGFWWSSSVHAQSGLTARYLSLSYKIPNAIMDSDYKTFGYSVRCMKD